MIAAVDEFIIYDDVQYTRRDWRNRNLIKTPQGAQWITVPVVAKGKYHQKICETQIGSGDWANAHWKALSLNYGRAPFFEDVASWLKPIYVEETFTHLSQLNRRLIEAICAYLSIRTDITSSSDYNLLGDKSERLAAMCVQAGATEYISGPAAKNYLDKKVFSESGLKLTWFEYADYPHYPQLWDEFLHGVTILDLLFNCGRDAPRYMRYLE